MSNEMIILPAVIQRRKEARSRSEFVAFLAESDGRASACRVPYSAA